MDLMIENIRTIVIAAAAVATAGATIVLAIVTRKYVRLTREMLEASYKPEVIVRLLGRGVTSVPVAPTEYTQRPILILSVKNVGSGVAHKIKFEADLDFAPSEDRDPLGSVYFLRNGIEQLAPGEERIASNNTFVGNPSRDRNQLQTTIRGTWEDPKGTEYSGDFHLDFTDPNLPDINKR